MECSICHDNQKNEYCECKTPIGCYSCLPKILQKSCICSKCKQLIPVSIIQKYPEFESYFKEELFRIAQSRRFQTLYEISIRQQTADYAVFN